jgi:uncharacterized protein (TIGR02118 family)
MYKLVILIEPQDDASDFDSGWPEFLHHSERMPGLLREATSRVDAVIYGQVPVSFMHELFFESAASAQQAMSSEQGRQAGQILQQITQGRMTLFFADHKEDDIENLRRYHDPDNEASPVAGQAHDE